MHATARRRRRVQYSQFGWCRMNEPWQQFIPYWLRTAVPFGIDPGLLSRPVGQATENSLPTPSPSVLLDGGLLGNLNRSWDQSGGDGGILGSLASPPNGQ